MLKVSHITFTDSKSRELFIDGRHVEFFPFIGGEEANRITTKAWNQHGNTHYAAYMESFEGEIVFIIPFSNMSDNEIQTKRNEIVDVANPLNGTITMKIVLTNGQAFSRDITFVSAPSFPIGFENRNKDWQKVQLFYEANNPFWYKEETIVETFQTVEPLFIFPFTMASGTRAMTANFDNKIYNSTVENPNLFTFKTGNVLYFPADYTDIASQALVDAIKTRDGNYSQININTTGHRSQAMFSFDILSNLERKYGIEIWNGQTLLENKIAIAKSLITKITYRLTAYGKAPTGNKIYMSRWNPELETWSGGYLYTHSTFVESFINSTSISNNIDSKGFVYMLTYSDVSDGSIGSTYIRIDAASIDIEIQDDDLADPIYFGNVLPSNTAKNEGQVEAPVIIKIVGACTNPLIENKTTGEFIKFKNLTMNTQDELMIDTTFGQKKVELNGQNVFNKLDFTSTFFNLQIGENEIEFTDESASNAATIHFIYRNLYITI